MMTFVIPMKLSTNTSNSKVVCEGAGALVVVKVARSCIMVSSKGWHGRVYDDVNVELMMSQAVSVPEQNRGGLSHHPIWRLLGTTISTSSMEDGAVWFGNT